MTHEEMAVDYIMYLFKKPTFGKRKTEKEIRSAMLAKLEELVKIRQSDEQNSFREKVYNFYNSLK